MIKLKEKEDAAYLSVPKSYLTYELNLNEKIKFLILCSLGLFCIAFIFYHNIIFSVLSAFLSYPCLSFYRDYLSKKRRKELKEQFRDVLYSVSASIAAGHQMIEALFEAEKNLKLIYKDDSLIILELSYMVKKIYEYRESEEEILKDFALRTSIEDISDFVDIYLTCRETGGDLIKVLIKATEVIMDKIIIEREISTITSQKRFEAKILTAIPLIIILFLQMVSPEYLAVLYKSIQGRCIMTAALLGIGIAYLWSMRLTDIEI